MTISNEEYLDKVEDTPLPWAAGEAAVAAKRFLQGTIERQAIDNTKLKAQLKQRDEELSILHRRLADAELRARQGWERYEAANRAHINLQMRFADKFDQKEPNVV